MEQLADAYNRLKSFSGEHVLYEAVSNAETWEFHSFNGNKFIYHGKTHPFPNSLSATVEEYAASCKVTMQIIQSMILIASNNHDSATIVVESDISSLSDLD